MGYLQILWTEMLNVQGLKCRERCNLLGKFLNFGKYAGVKDMTNIMSGWDLCFEYQPDIPLPIFFTLTIFVNLLSVRLLFWIPGWHPLPFQVKIWIKRMDGIESWTIKLGKRGFAIVISWMTCIFSNSLVLKRWTWQIFKSLSLCWTLLSNISISLRSPTRKPFRRRAY